MEEGNRKKSVRENLALAVHDFAENTTVNGIKFIAQKESSIIERLFWIFTFIFSSFICAYVLYQSYLNWQEHGIIIALKEQPVSVDKIPFPAVTICPQARIRSTYVEDITYSLLLFCKFRSNLTSKLFSDETVDMNTFFEVAPKHEDVFLKCTWRNKDYNCDHLFRPVLTDDGVCFTFNTIAADEMFHRSNVQQRHLYLNTTTRQKGWSLEDNYYSNEKNPYPRRGRGNAAREDLSVTLKEITDRDVSCDQQTRSGYKIYLHHPADMPQATLHYYPAQPQQTTSFAVKLDILETNDDLIDKTSEERQCFYPSEMKLNFFRKYTSKNCELECLTNYTLEKCNCVGFYMLRDNNTNVCNAKKSQCLYNALDDYANELSGNEENQCNCLPSCNTINYNPEVTVAHFDQMEYENPDDGDNDNDEDANDNDNSDVSTQYNNDDDENNDGEDYDENNIDKEVDKLVKKYVSSNTRSIVEIKMYFKESRFIAMKRKELMDVWGFISDAGGTLGLFIGFTVCTLAEFIHFFVIKLFYIATARRTNSSPN